MQEGCHNRPSYNVFKAAIDGGFKAEFRRVLDHMCIFGSCYDESAHGVQPDIIQCFVA